MQVYYLGYGGLKQVDLSDDQVVAAVATDDWENAMKPVEVSTADVWHESLGPRGCRSRQLFVQEFSQGFDQISSACNEACRGEHN